jgi:hypothetical protein
VDNSDRIPSYSNANCDIIQKENFFHLILLYAFSGNGTASEQIGLCLRDLV